jgi:hypothetical protein
MRNDKMVGFARGTMSAGHGNAGRVETTLKLHEDSLWLTVGSLRPG